MRGVQQHTRQDGLSAAVVVAEVRPRRIRRCAMATRIQCYVDPSKGPGVAGGGDASPPPPTEDYKATNSTAVPPVRGATAAAVESLSHQQLLDLASAFVSAWFKGIAAGPAAVEGRLRSILDPHVTLCADGVRSLHDVQGLAEVLAELERSHLEYPRSSYKPLLYAASVERQRAYALVEGRHQDVGALPGHPATFRVSKVQHIAVLQVDPSGSRHATQLWLTRALTEEDKDELLADPIHAYPAPFPVQALRAAPQGNRAQLAAKLERAMRRWWAAWAGPGGGGASSNGGSSGSNGASVVASSTHATVAEEAGGANGEHASSSSSSGCGSNGGSNSRGGSAGSSASSSAAFGSAAAGPSTPTLTHWFIRRMLDPGFMLYDAYGLWPSMRPAAGYASRRSLDKGEALEYLAGLRQRYELLSLQVLDVAVAEGTLATFTHWRMVLAPRSSNGEAASSGSARPDPLQAAALPGGGAECSGSGSGSSENGAHSTVAAQPLPEQQHQQGEQQPLVLPPSAAAARHGSAFSLEGLEVDLFNEDLSLKGIWQFRSPLDSEAGLLLAQARETAAAEAAAEAAEQEAVRAARRAAREAQLHELLSWMAAYQESWADYMTHVQAALARQQERLRRPLQGGGGGAGGGAGEGSGGLQGPADAVPGADSEQKGTQG